MKKWRRILIVLAFVALPVAAQDGLHIAKFFDGRYRERKDAVEVIMKGRSVMEYGLSVFHSLALERPGGDVAEMERCVKLDGARAIDSEVGMKGGRLYYGFYQLQPKDGENRYLFYRNDALGNQKRGGVTLIFMQGVATLDMIRKNFMK